MSYNQIDDRYKESLPPSPEQEAERQDVLSVTTGINEWFNNRIRDESFPHYPIELIYSSLNESKQVSAFLNAHPHSHAITKTRIWVVNNLIGTRIKGYIDSRNSGKVM